MRLRVLPFNDIVKPNRTNKTFEPIEEPEASH